MATYTFDIHFTGPAGEATIDSLYEAGWDDATVSFDPATGGAGIATFDREASSAVEAIASAIATGRGAGVAVTGVAENLVPFAEIAERTGRTLATVDHWVKGRRGPGGFPEPKIKRPKVSLYSWAEVTHWLHDHELAEVSATDVETARVCEIADSLVRAHRLQHELPPKDRRLLRRAVA
ncbi:MAG: hypothetical protein GEV04_13190 [Actinophytocola sp.]|nr:hypothetical protein [Actinophytocola sp.]